MEPDKVFIYFSFRSVDQNLSCLRHLERGSTFAVAQNKIADNSRSRKIHWMRYQHFFSVREIASLRFLLYHANNIPSFPQKLTTYLD